jgi:hypothetical protein
MALLEIDELQATAILDMQLRRLAALERQKIIDEYDELMVLIAGYNEILASPEKQRQIISEELAATVEKYGDERRTEILRGLDGGPHRRGGRGRHDYARRVREAHERESLSRTEARGEGRPRGLTAAGRHRRALLRHHHAPLDPVLHEQGSGVPDKGVSIARFRAGRQGDARRESAGLPARRDHRAGPLSP